MIKAEKGKFVLYSKDGKKKIGEAKTKKEAKKRLKEIEYFKHRSRQ